jgi:NADPH-dependent 2,4-dienoyl-CoA reductase/sulfur reductase-like enzyme
VTLADGQIIKGDMLITGIGVFPDSQIAVDAGLETLREDGGPILVDDMMQTSHVDVLAIGDVALKRSQAMAVESVHNAQETAAVAASTVTGVAPPVIQTPWFWSDQYDAKLQSVGIVPVLDEQAYQVTRPGKREGGISFWTYKGEELIAVEVINDPATYMEARQCLDTKQSPDPNQISDRLFSPVDSGGARS